MQILFVGYNLFPESGGVFNSVTRFIRAMQMYGHDTKCISFTDCLVSSPHSDPNWLNLPVPGSMLGKSYGYIRRSELQPGEELIREADVVFVHLLYRYHCIWAARVARDHGKPVIVVPHGTLDPWVFTYRGLRKRAWLHMHRNLLFGDGNTVLFATQAESLKAKAVVTSARERVISWSAERLTRGGKPDRRPDGHRKLLMVGRLHPMKRVIETIQALRRVGGSHWTLTVAGPPTTEISPDDLRKAAGPLWDSQIRYVGHLDREQLFPLYAESDALLQLSHRENFGYAVAEAMCEGLPVVVSEGVDISPIVSNWDCGLVRAIRSDTDIDRILADLLALSTERLGAMGLAAAAAARSEFSFERFAGSVNDLVVSTVRQRSLTLVS